MYHTSMESDNFSGSVDLIAKTLSENENEFIEALKSKFIQVLELKHLGFGGLRV